MLLRMPISLLIVSMPLELLWILHRHVGHGNAETYFVDWQHISLQLGLLGLRLLVLWLVLGEVGLTLTWTKLNASHVVHISYSVH